MTALSESPSAYPADYRPARTLAAVPSRLLIYWEQAAWTAFYPYAALRMPAAAVLFSVAAHDLDSPVPETECHYDRL